MNSIKIPLDKVDPSIKNALEKLVKLDLDFYVCGGLLCQPYLNDHARYTKDIDIIFNDDPKVVEQKLKEVFGQILFDYEDARENFYEPSFTSFVIINNQRSQIEGKRVRYFENIKTVTYSLDGITFKGTSIEYPIAEKLMSLLCELSRPYKHLVDIYSFSQIDQSLIDKKEVIRYMNLINEQENIFRKNIGLKEYILPKEIPQNKAFIGDIIMPTLQSKYNVSKNEMINAVNTYLKSLWHICDK